MNTLVPKVGTAREHSAAFMPILHAGVPRPQVDATIGLLFGLMITWLSASGDTASGLMRFVAVGTAASLALSAFLEVRRGGLTALLRTDLVAMAALYFMLFLEFLFPQPGFDELIPTNQGLQQGITCCLSAFGALAIGRHFVSSRIPQWSLVERGAPPGILLFLFWLSVAVGYFHMLLAVNFDPFEMVRYFFEPRFDAPWQRGQFGDAKALLSEIGALIYLIPPLSGVILGRKESYSVFSRLLVFGILLFTLFYGFCTGTRNIIGAYLLSFLVAYFYATGASWRSSLVPALLALALMGLATYYGPSFRNIGLKQYLSGKMESAEDLSEEKFYVDYNFYVVAVLTHLFPNSFEYVGWKAPVWLIVRPIPRVLWPDKPDGADVSAQTYVLGTQENEGGTTITASVIGEAYMTYGLVGVIVALLALGYLCQWWTQKAFSTITDFGILIYGSGFYAVAITMRSIYMLPVAILPTLAAAAIGFLLIRRTSTRYR